jgi:hypothetical protein
MCSGTALLDIGSKRSQITAQPILALLLDCIGGIGRAQRLLDGRRDSRLEIALALDGDHIATNGRAPGVGHPLHIPVVRRATSISVVGLAMEARIGEGRPARRGDRTLQLQKAGDALGQINDDYDNYDWNKMRELKYALCPILFQARDF